MKHRVQNSPEPPQESGALSKFYLWWPLLCGVLIGVQGMLTALVFLGPGQLRPEVAAQLTAQGLFWIRPEHDVGIFALGCMLTTLLVLGLGRLWRSRLASNRSVIPSGARLLILAALFVGHLWCLLVVRSYSFNYFLPGS